MSLSFVSMLDRSPIGPATQHTSPTDSEVKRKVWPLPEVPFGCMIVRGRVIEGLVAFYRESAPLDSYLQVTKRRMSFPVVCMM